MGDEERHGRVMQHVIGNASEEPFAQARMPVTAHHDEVGIQALGFRRQCRRDVAISDLGAVQLAIDSVVVEMRDRIGAEQRVLLDRIVVADDHKGDGSRLVEIRQ
jgi:hypothetical protein